MKPTPIITEEKRMQERRSDWHTPNDCTKLLNVQDAMARIQSRLDDGSVRMGRIEASIDALTNLQEKSAEDRDRFERKLDDNSSMTSNIVDFSKSLEGFVKVANWIGKFVAWAGAIIAPIAGIYIAFKDSHPK